MHDTNEPTEAGTCPGADALDAFYVGKLPAPALDAIGQHLAECADCTAYVDRVSDRDDLLVSELRRPARTSTLTADERERAAMLAENADPERTTAVGPGATPGPTPAPTGIAPAPHAGQLGQYELLDKLGEGGMGQVFKARHVLMDRVVALKVIHERFLEHPEAVHRFHREIQALARLNHPNIVSAQYADQVGHTHFLVMEYVAGRTLTQRVQDGGPLPVAEACDYVRQTAAALAHAHEHGLVHRDLKPSNLLLTPAGQVKLLDLGLAQLQEDCPAGEEVTALGHALGTPDYMAPEQWDNAHAVDIRADLYSLGCTFFYLLAGRPPFSGAEHSSRARKMKAHLAAPVPDIRAERPDVPDALVAVLERLLAKDPRERNQSPAALIGTLDRLAQSADPDVIQLTQPYVPASAAPRAEIPIAMPVGKQRGSKRVRLRFSLGCVSITIALAFCVMVVCGGGGTLLFMPSVKLVRGKAPRPLPDGGPFAQGPVLPMPVAPGPTLPKPLAPGPANPTPVVPPKVHEVSENGLTLEGIVAPTDPVVIKINNQHHLRAKLFLVKLSAGKKYRITMDSKELDSYLHVVDEAGGQAKSDDDSGGNLNALLNYSPAKDGTYKIFAAAFKGEGRFTLRVREIIPVKIPDVDKDGLTLRTAVQLDPTAASLVTAPHPAPRRKTLAVARRIDYHHFTEIHASSRVISHDKGAGPCAGQVFSSSQHC